MEQPIGGSRITIDFRDAIEPGRGWILGVADGRSRVELLAFGETAPARPAPPVGRALPARMAPAARLSPSRATPIVALQADCTCPEFCERDHANE